MTLPIIDQQRVEGRLYVKSMLPLVLCPLMRLSADLRIHVLRPKSKFLGDRHLVIFSYRFQGKSTVRRHAVTAGNARLYLLLRRSSVPTPVFSFFVLVEHFLIVPSVMGFPFLTTHPVFSLSSLLNGIPLRFNASWKWISWFRLGFYLLEGVEP